MTDITGTRPGAGTETGIIGAQADAETANNNSNQIVAMFEDRAEADAARDALEAAGGIERSRIQIMDSSGMAAETRSYDVQRDEGLWAAIKSFFMPDEDAHVYAEGVRRGHAMLVVQAGKVEKESILSILDSLNPIDVETSASEWREGGWSGVHQGQAAWEAGRSASATTSPSVGFGAETAASSPLGVEATEPAPTTVGPGGEDREELIPVYEERLRVGKREVGRGSVRVRSYVVETPVQQDVRLHDERVEVERRPVDRVVNESALGASPFQERTVEATARGEEPVIDKEMRVKEEVAVRKEEQDRTETVRDAVRHTEVEVDDDRARSGTAPDSLSSRKP